MGIGEVMRPPRASLQQRRAVTGQPLDERPADPSLTRQSLARSDRRVHASSASLNVDGLITTLIFTTTASVFPTDLWHDGFMELRRADGDDWERIWPIWHEVVATGETYPWGRDTSKERARELWMLPSPAEVWVATSGPEIVGTALLKPNQPGLGSHVANAGFMVAPSVMGHGVGRRLGEHIVARARALGYLGMQFNAVVATNERAIALWCSLGFSIIGTVPRAFRHPRHGLVGLHIMYRALN